MRDAFFDELKSVFTDNPNVVFITGDLGYKLFDPLKDIDAERVINIGIREAGMVGFAAGLARGGMIPFVYSIVPFITLRCLEQIKIDVCYNRNRVILVGVGGGVSYGPNGPTHHGVDDIGVLSCLPRMTIWTPSDPLEVRACVRESMNIDGPAYLRLGRNAEPAIRDSSAGLPNISDPVVLQDGGGPIIISCGVILGEVLKAADVLKQKGISPTVVHVPTMRPFPDKFILKVLAKGGPVVTVEEHIPVGGLGSEIARLIATTGSGNRLKSLSLPMSFNDICMDRPGILKSAGIDAQSIASEIENICL